MKIIDSKDIIEKNIEYGIGLGNFDGVHRAHEFLITELVNECRKKNIRSMIYTFRKHPGNILEGNSIKLISSLESRIERFRELGVDCLCLVDFTEEYANITASSFVKKILKEKYNTKLVVTGFNYRFGKGGKGSTNLLEKLGKELDFDVLIVPPVMLDNQVISSTLIREKIKDGKMESARNMMGKNYSIKGKVEYGNKIGTEIGFPTANIRQLKDFALPKSGVYYTNTIVDGITYKSITNIGNNPTVSEKKRVVIETHIFDFNSWLYGKDIEVQFISMIREEKKFSSIKSLKKNIISDIKLVKKRFVN
ncbi:MAG: bifunctional riboflavin kinase/FAD synthetase [Clostridiales bacterium]|nr:bifunctional riboflavin kinase/FAD synthetase [Clostridiales bacterium]